MATTEREATAYHEAGHAVMRWTQHRGLRSVTIGPGEGYREPVRHDPVGKWFRPDVEIDGRVLRRIEDDIRAAWAGPVAQAIHRGDPEAKAAGNDLNAIVDLALHASGSTEEAEAYIEWLRVGTLSRLRQPPIWRAVEALAGALLERGTIRWQDAKQIMQAAAHQIASD